ncbi:hypothetical protein C0Q70_21626 [Pomacea canaliculata]|uniref:Uncharacterized protein n=1 Tax=Pomacea canaliculata TaxID=400727 RepID=A0A2T7ND25_POMCA|nr:hypothetical protein C0Q70_21626 [Pomacea canaliculata]
MEVGEGGYDASALDLTTRVNNTCMSGWSKVNMCVPSQSNMGKRVSFGWDRADNFPVHPLPQTTCILTGFRLQEDRPSSNKSVSIVRRSCLGREESVDCGRAERHQPSERLVKDTVYWTLGKRTAEWLERWRPNRERAGSIPDKRSKLSPVDPAEGNGYLTP